MDVGVPRRVDLVNVLVETLSAWVIALEIANLYGTGPVTLPDVEATAVGNAAVGARRGSPWGARVGVDTEVLGKAALTPDVTTCLFALSD
jgi:hypothetical protein